MNKANQQQSKPVETGDEPEHDIQDDLLDEDVLAENAQDDIVEQDTLNQGTNIAIPKVPGRNIGTRMAREELETYTSTSPVLTGGDVDAAWEQADSVGEEAVGGTVATPDKNVTEDLEKAVGLEIDDRSFLRTQDVLEERDDSRWELDPSSSEDYQERRE